MKKVFIFIVLVSQMYAYMINGMYFTLESCVYGQMGYKFGYIGTYSSVSGERYQVFFSNKYCEY